MFVRDAKEACLKPQNQESAASIFSHFAQPTFSMGALRGGSFLYFWALHAGTAIFGPSRLQRDGSTKSAKLFKTAPVNPIAYRLWVAPTRGATHN